jgi:hypothetical protein
MIPVSMSVEQVHASAGLSDAKVSVPLEARELADWGLTYTKMGFPLRDRLLLIRWGRPRT